MVLDSPQFWGESVRPRSPCSRRAELPDPHHQAMPFLSIRLPVRAESAHEKAVERAITLLALKSLMSILLLDICIDTDNNPRLDTKQYSNTKDVTIKNRPSRVSLFYKKILN